MQTNRNNSRKSKRQVPTTVTYSEFGSTLVYPKNRLQSNQPSLQLVPFCQLCTPQNSLHALSLFICKQGTQLCSLHSLIHIKDDPYLPCSGNKISQHNLKGTPDTMQTMHYVGYMKPNMIPLTPQGHFVPQL